MKRMWSKNELKNIADNQAKEVKKDIATLVDANGHDRFIEGDMENSTIEGLTITYSKWSLSGTHLMIVVAGKIDNDTTLTSQQFISITKDLPQWVLDKIVVVWSSYLESRNFTVYANDWSSSQSLSVALRKQESPTPKFGLFLPSSFTATADRYFRLSFDLLIDNE